jgi:hypothetical protein
VEDAVCVAVLHVGCDGFLVLVEGGYFLCTGPLHCDGWVDDFLRYYYFGCLVYMDPFDERFFNSLVLFVLIPVRRVTLRSTIRWARIVAGWMPAIVGPVAGHSCCLKFLSSRVWRDFLVG